jgi:hypothetical protein
MGEILSGIAKYHNYTSGDRVAEAIASGELATVLLPDEQRSKAIVWLNEQAEVVEDPTLGEALKDIADQLRAAVEREREADIED